MSEIYNHYSGRNLGRVQGLADGVFAVAMTLLVLDLRLPDAGGPADSDHALWSQLNSFARRGDGANHGRDGGHDVQGRAVGGWRPTTTWTRPCPSGSALRSRSGERPP